MQWPYTMQCFCQQLGGFVYMRLCNCSPLNLALGGAAVARYSTAVNYTHSDRLVLEAAVINAPVCRCVR